MNGVATVSFSAVMEVNPVNESSPIAILVGALVATLALAVVVQQINGFGVSAGENTDVDAFGSLIKEIENQCNQLEENAYVISSSTKIEITRGSIKINESTMEAKYSSEETEEEREIRCEPGLSFETSDQIESDHTLGTGVYDVRFSDGDEGLKVEVS